MLVFNFFHFRAFGRKISILLGVTRFLLNWNIFLPPFEVLDTVQKDFARSQK